MSEPGTGERDAALHFVVSRPNLGGVAAHLKNRTHSWVLFASLMLILLSCFGEQAVHQIPSVSWERQYPWVAGISGLLTVICYVFPPSWKRMAALIARYLLVFVVYLPSGLTGGLRSMLAMSLVMDLAWLLSFPVNLTLSMGALLSTAFFSVLSRSMTQGAPLPGFFESATNLVPSMLIAAFASQFRRIDSRLHADETRIENFQRTINKLTDANTGFQHYVKVVEVKSSEDERNRIIRELHDSLGYTMTSIIMLSESGLKMARQHENSELSELLGHINTSGKTGLTDIRIALRIMKPKKQTAVSPSKRLEELVTAFERATDVKIHLKYNHISDTMDSERFHIVFRFIQEGMINSFRHGAAKNIRITLFQEDNRNLIITIMDDGTGFQELTVGLGLKGIAERLERVGGEFSIHNTPWGVRLRAAMPLSGIPAGSAASEPPETEEFL